MNEYPEGNYVKQVTKFYDYASEKSRLQMHIKRI